LIKFNNILLTIKSHPSLSLILTHSSLEHTEMQLIYILLTLSLLKQAIIKMRLTITLTWAQSKMIQKSAISNLITKSIRKKVSKYLNTYLNSTIKIIKRFTRFQIGQMPRSRLSSNTTSLLSKKSQKNKYWVISSLSLG